MHSYITGWVISAEGIEQNPYQSAEQVREICFWWCVIQLGHCKAGKLHTETDAALSNQCFCQTLSTPRSVYGFCFGTRSINCDQSMEPGRLHQAAAGRHTDNAECTMCPIQDMYVVSRGAVRSAANSYAAIACGGWLRPVLVIA